MDELVRLVAQRTGLPEEQARAATLAVIDFIKAKLPAPLAGQIDSLLSGGGSAGLGGLLGRR